MFKIIFFLLSFNCVFSQIQIGQDIDGEAAYDISGWSVNLSSSGNILAIGARLNDGNGDNSGHVRVYQNLSGVWTQIGSDLDGEAQYDNSGYSVSLSSDGSIVAIGAISNDGNGNSSGQVRVYQNLSGVWTQIGSDIDGEAANDLSGYSVCLSSNGNILAIGALFNDGNGIDAGHVRVYQNITGNWFQIGNDIDGEAAGDRFGCSLSLSSDGTKLAIGAPFNDGNGIDAGHVRVYQNVAGNWTQIGNDIDGEAAGDQSGCSLSLTPDGAFLAIGALLNDGNGLDTGHVRVYQNIAGNWTQIGSDIDGEGIVDHFGYSISLSSNGNILAVGARSNDGNGTDSGNVRVYRNIAGSWMQIGNDINGEASFDGCGWSVSLSSNGSVIAIGAIYNDGNGIDSGQVRVFDISALLNNSNFVMENFTIYPNPTSELLTIRLENNLILEKINIYNTLGQLIQTENKQEIDISSLAKATYFIEVITNKGKATKQIIVN